MRSALLASTAFLQAICSCAQTVSKTSLLFVLLIAAFCIATFSVAAYGQCPPVPTGPPSAPTLTATTGADYGQIQWTGAGTDPCSTTEWFFVLANGANYSFGTTSGTAQFQDIRGGLGSNWRYYFRARSRNALYDSPMVEVNAMTRDLPNPLLAAWTGPGPDKITIWSRALGHQNYQVPVHVHMITPSNIDTNLANFYLEDIGPKAVGFSPSPGLYTFYSISDEINPGLEKKRSSNLYLYIDANGDQHWGNPGCNGVHKPVDVTTGNMYVSETDYTLPGIGENIVIERSYNSFSTYSGIFGAGWSTQYDEKLTAPSGLALRLQMPDGRAIYFGRPDAAAEIYQSASHDFRGIIRKNTDNTYSLEMYDGRIHKYGTDGRLLWLKDRNNNQTTLNYTSGFLTGVTDAFGRTVTFTLNANGTVSQMSDALGVIATYAYVPSTDLLQSVTYPDGSKRQYAYTTVNGRSIIQTITDALGNILETHQYDPQGRAITSELGGNIEKYTLDYSIPTKTVVTDALGNVTNYHFDNSFGRRLLTKIEGLCGCAGGSETTEFFYDYDRNLSMKRDALGRETNYTYDSNRNVTSIQDVLGTQTFTYNSFGEVLTAMDRMGGVTTNTYSTTGNLLTSTDALNSTTTLTYTSLGQPATITDALNHTTTLTWDTQGRMTKIRDANNKETNFGYDTRSRVTSVTNALSQTTNVQYDLNNRLKKIIYPDTNFVTYTYNLAGRRTGVTDPLTHTTTYGYDGAYRLTSITDALNHSTTYGYDLMSNLTSQTDALGNITNLEYDNFNRLKKIKYPLVGATRLEENYTYDLVGNVKTRVDTAGRATAYDYDNANRLITITDALNQLTHFEYNARSQMTKVTDALNQEYVFDYDALGRQLSQTRAGTTMSYEYDAVGNRTKRTDYTGRETNYTYDVLNRLTNITYSGQSSDNASYAYDVLSRLTSATNYAGTVSFSYDSRNRLTEASDVFGRRFGYGYDAAGNRKQMKLSGESGPNINQDDGGHVLQYNYDAANRLTQIINESQNYNFNYDAANRLISKNLPNGVTTTYNYDGMSRLTRLKHQTAATTLVDNQYSYNSANQISQITDLTETRNFGYDDVDRLTSMTNGTADENYSFDAVGNRTSSHLSSHYAYKDFNRLVETDTAYFENDENGEPITIKDQNGTTQFEWDFENRLRDLRSDRVKEQYKYDALGRRVEQIQDATSTKFVYDGLDVVVDKLPDDSFVKYVNGPGIDNKLGYRQNGSNNYFLQDHLGSTVGLTNSSGTVTETNSYDSFGNPTNAGFSSRYQFTGREYDAATSLQFSRARWYDPNLGRFISEDPIGFYGGDMNLYGYVRNNPMIYLDPEGTQIRSDSRYQPYSPEDNRRMVQNVMSMPSPTRLLTQCERGWLSPYFPDIDFDGITVHNRLPPWHNPQKYSGFTGSPNDIYFTDKYDPNSIDSLGTAGHELTHVRQWRQNGTLSFIPRYAWDLMKNGGYSEDIPFENEAYAKGKRIRDDLEKRNASGERQCGCEGGLRP